MEDTRDFTSRGASKIVCLGLDRFGLTWITLDLKWKIAKIASDCATTKLDVRQGNTAITYTYVLTPVCLDLAQLWTLYGHRA